MDKLYLEGFLSTTKHIKDFTKSLLTYSIALENIIYSGISSINNQSYK